MRSTPLRFVLAALTATTLVVAVVPENRQGSGRAEAHHKAQTAKQEKKLRPGCRRHYRQAKFVRYTKTRYTQRTRPLTKGQKQQVRHLAFCLANKKKTRWAFQKKRVWRSQFRGKLAYYRLTPYPGPGNTRWAIPWSIVACESGGSWTAYNGSSGARGPYQFLGWNVPWPVNSWSDRLAHHRMAANLYAGGRGRSHWVC